MWNFPTFCCVTQSLIPPVDNTDCHCCVLLLKTNILSANRHCFIHPSSSGAYTLYWLLIHHKPITNQNHSDTHCTYLDTSKKNVSYENTGETIISTQYNCNWDSPSSHLNCALLFSCSLVKHLPCTQKAFSSVAFVVRTIQRE